MTDLRDRLQTALGDAYRIEQELGGGGMSRVFLAEETGLGRKVVIKVLPPEMAAGVNIERFRREIQLAASLQHPHIVPLHAAGQAGDLFYYTMPLVEGESLRAKLAREGELPVGEVVHILRDVADALAYAHHRGVVHRDIKPDNVLLTGSHAVVTDFGVAKAVSAASGESTLTSLGVALGTPAYMAPEQAAADPHVDHRADLYAVGAMAYEMLCGRPPFHGMTPQAMLAAHVTQAPDPPSSHRPAVPASLNTLVMRCLEKKPADRVQRAEELLGELQAMATPSGGMAPTGAATISSGTEAAIRRAHPVRVGVLFGLGGAVLLALVDLLMQQLGLPTWVFPAAAVLLAVGFPIMVLTGLFERRRAVARTTGYSPAVRGVGRWLTWRRSLLAGGIAFGALTLAAAVYMAMRLLGIGSVGTLVAKGALKARDPILLADFENRTTDSTLGPTLTEALRVDLSQSPTVKLLDQQDIAEGLARMERPPGTAIVGGVARELAQRTGAKAIVTGEIHPAGGGYVLSANILATADGSLLVAVRENAADDAALLGALDRLSHDVRERIGESLTSLRETLPLERVTTASIDALRRYSEGVRRFNLGRYDEAASLLRDAVALDTGFAMAWRKIAATLTRMGGSNEGVAAAASEAYALSDRLPEVERNLATAAYYSLVEWDPTRIVTAYRAALDRDPTNEIALSNLASELTRERQFAAAESLARRGGQPLVLAPVLAAQGRYAEAAAALERARTAAPQDPYPVVMRCFLALAEGASATADSLGRAFLSRPTAPFAVEWMTGLMGLAATTRGRLALAERQLHDASALAQSLDRGRDYLQFMIAMAWNDLLYRARPPDGMARIATALAHVPLDSLPANDRPYAELAWFYAAAGHPKEAERLLRDYAAAVPGPQRRAQDSWTFDYEQYGARGAIAEAEQRPQEAIRLFQAYHDSSGCAICGLYELASVYDRLGQRDSALAVYRRYVDTPGLDRGGELINLAPSYRRLGELYEARGDRDDALIYYDKLVDLWKDADPELQPIVRDVKARIARLAGEKAAL
jgi:tetratricopeptide (TPR) repeat protein